MSSRKINSEIEETDVAITFELKGGFCMFFPNLAAERYLKLPILIESHVLCHKKKRSLFSESKSCLCVYFLCVISNSENST